MHIVYRLFLAATLLAMPAAGLGQTAVASEPLTIARCSPGEAAIATQGFARLGGAEQWVTIRAPTAEIRWSCSCTVAPATR